MGRVISDNRTVLDKTIILNDIKRVMIRMNDKTINQSQYIRNNGAVNEKSIMKFFGTFKNAVKIIENDDSITGAASPITIERDIKKVASILGKNPTRDEYLQYGKFGKNTIVKNYGSWTNAVKTILG